MLYQRGKVWWFKFRFCGRLIQESSKETNRNRAAEAERRYRNRLADSYNVVPKRKAPIPFSAAAEALIAGKARRWAPKSLTIERSNLKHLLPTFGAKLLTDINADSINVYIGARLQEAAAKTVMLEIGTMRAILRKHRLWGALLPDIDLPKVDNNIGRALSPEEESQLLTACAASRSRSLFPAVALDFNSGLRLSELRLLRWAQVNLTNRTLQVGDSKTEYGEGREVALNDRALAILTQWAASFPARRPEHFMFPAEKYGGGGAYATDPTQPIGSWKEAWEAAKKRASVKCRFHDLRHTAVSRMLDAGVPLSVVAAVMGWSPSTMVIMSKRYGHIGKAAGAEAVKSLNGPGTGFSWLQNQIQSGGNPGGTIQ
jgi:integrase